MFMFSQKKRNHTWLIVCGILAIIIVAVLILIGTLSSRNVEEAERTSLESRVEREQKLPETETQEQSEENDIGEETPQTQQEEENEQTEEFYQSYYLVRYDNNGIKIYFSDETGKLTELETTTIVYETLTAEDQQRFRDGVRLENRDDLNKLIMDYES